MKEVEKRSANLVGDSVEKSPEKTPTGGVFVSKKAQPDRPLQKSQQQRRRKSAVNAETADQLNLLLPPESRDDYRLGFSKEKKFNRSISQPGPPPTPLDLMLAASASSEEVKKLPGNKMRKYSFANEKRPDLEKLYQLRRSTSMIREDSQEFNSTRLGSSQNAALFLANMKPEKPDERMSRLTSLKKHIQSQLDQNSDGSLSLNSTFRRRSKNKKYEAIQSNASSSPNLNDGEDFDSDSSSDSKLRLSPPTQVQSLSEETSSADGRSSHSKLPTPSNFGSDDEDSDLEIVLDRAKSSSATSSSSSEEAISRKRILAAVAGVDLTKAKEKTSSSANLLPSSTSSSSMSPSSVPMSPASSTSLEDDVGGAEPSLDYVKKYGEVPRLLKQMSKNDSKGKDSAPGSNLKEDDSISILTDGMD